MTTPWEIGDKFTQMLAAQTARDDQIGSNMQDNMIQAEIARRNADATWGRQLAKDQIDYGQQIARDAANRNFITQRDATKAAKAGGAGRFSFLDQPGGAQPGATGAPPVAGSASDASGRVTPQSAMAYLTSQGVPPMVAAGIIGNVDVESAHFDPAVFAGTNRGDKGTAFGAGQWRHERQANLFQFAQSRGHPRPTPEDQFDFFTHEAVTGSDPGARTAFELAARAKTPEEAAAAIAQHYERPHDMGSLPQRQNAARLIYASAVGGAGAQPLAQPAVLPQRRYADPNAQPDPNADPNAQPAVEPASTGDPNADPLQTVVQEQSQETEDGEVPPEPVDPSVPTNPNASPAQTVEELKSTKMRPLTAAELQQAHITPFDLTLVDKGYDIVGTRFFSMDMYNNMDSAMRDLLVPLGGLNKNAGNEFLVLQKKDPNDIDPVTKEKIYNPDKDPANAPAAPAPGVAPAPAPMTTASTRVQPPPPPPTQVVDGAPTQAVSPAVATATAPTGGRTRRNAQGQLEVLVGNEWRPTGVGGGNA